MIDAIRRSERDVFTARLVAVVESVVFLARVNLDAMAAAGYPAKRLVVTGGLSRLDGFCGRLSSLTGLPLQRPEFTEATARGLAWLVAGRPAAWRAGEGERPFEPHADAALERRFRRWQRAMEQAL